MIENFFTKLDLTSAPAINRIKGDTSYSTMCGGIVSAITFLFFAVIFIMNLISLFKLQNISANISLVQDDPSSSIQNFYFMLGFNALDAYNSQQIFQFKLTGYIIDHNHSIYANQLTYDIPLSRCNQTFLLQMNVIGLQLFLFSNNISNYFCPPYKTADMFITGNPLLLSANILGITIKSCVNSTQNNFSCLNSTSKNAYIDFVTQNYGGFYVNLLLIDTSITPTQKTPIITNIKADQLISFGTNYGTLGTLQLLPFQIQTDQNFLPWPQYSYINGYSIEALSTSAVPTQIEAYLNLYIFKSINSVSIDRQLGKIDDLLSYVGGLFSLLFVLVAFFIGPYNQYKYELLIAQNCFKSNIFQEYSEEKINFLEYLKIKLVIILDSIGIQTKNTHNIKQLQQMKQEAAYLLDPRFILKRIVNLEKMQRYYLNQHQIICIQMSQMPTYKHTKRQRKISFNPQIKTIQNQKIARQLLQMNITSFPLNENNQNLSQNTQKNDKSPIDSSQQEDEQIKKQVRIALKKLKEGKYDERFKNLCAQINHRQEVQSSLVTLQNKQQKNQFENKLKIKSRMKYKMCEICNQKNPNCISKCGHYFHVRCLQKNQELKLNSITKIDSQELIIIQQSQTRQQINCIVCKKQINPLAVSCCVCSQNWGQFEFSGNHFFKQKYLQKMQTYTCKECNMKKLFQKFS